MTASRMRLRVLQTGLLLLAALVPAPSPAENIVYPPEAKAVIDVTKAPYFADNSGKTDCTAALIRAVDDALREDRQAMQETLAIVQGEKKDVFTANVLPFAERQRILAANPRAVIGFERTRGIFPYKNPTPRILYFPNGTYLVSNTVVYTFTDLRNVLGKELNRCLHFQGQSERGTILRLRDGAPGFDPGARKPVVSFTRGNTSNVSMQNTFENFTILVGKGNPGAVGLEFFANNTGAIRNVSIRSLDPNRAGHAGLSMTTVNFSGVLVQHLTVEGFDFGVKVTHHRLNAVFEHIRVTDQRNAGFYLEDNNVSVRKLTSHNRVPAVRVRGAQATLALVEGDFSGGAATAVAAECESGFLFARGLKTAGYRAAIEHAGQTVAAGKNVDEFVSYPVVTLFPDQSKRSLGLPIEETPETPWEQDPRQWASVNEFDARGDGFADDTAAIQRAMNSGRNVIYFQPGIYLINGSINVPASVRRIDFMYGDLVAGPDLQQRENAGAFRVMDGKEPLVIENLYAFELYFGAHYLVDHASRRTVVLQDLHTQVGAMYRNSVPGGKVFIENVCTTDSFEPNPNCFTFTGQNVWARQLNPERANPQVLNDGSQLWVLGFKTEGGGCAFRTTGGGSTEVLNGIFNLWRRPGATTPAVINENSEVSIVASTTGTAVKPGPYFLIEETRAGQTQHTHWNELPRRDGEFVALPLYVGYRQNHSNDRTRANLESVRGAQSRDEDRLGEMITIPSGRFLMGNGGKEGFGTPEEFPQHWVELPTYQIGKHEVTRGQYRKFIEAGGYEDLQYWSAPGWKWKESNDLIYAGMNGRFNRATRPGNPGPRRAPERWDAEQEWIGHGHAHPRFTQTDQHPVVGVTYYEAEAYCRWAGGRLPTEAEWEKAARWDEKQQHARIWPWGDTWDAEKCNNPDDHNPAGGGYKVNQSAPAGSYPAGASPYGCLDMVGNAWEWVASRSQSHPGNPAPYDHGDAYRLVKGGCWDDGPSASARCSYRKWYLPLGSSGPAPSDCDFIGFRVAR